MMNGRNNGKKLMAVRIVAHAFEIVRLSLRAFLACLQLASQYRRIFLTFARSTS
jgi:ribosomal protein S7